MQYLVWICDITFIINSIVNNISVFDGVIINIINGSVDRSFNEEIGLNLFKF